MLYILVDDYNGPLDDVLIVPLFDGVNELEAGAQW